MSASDPTSPIEAALTELVVNCPELTCLEARLARFNIFRVLRADRNELRHSNMLAWLLQPEESHGLDDRFLRRWLIRVLHDAASNPPKGWVSPISVDTLAIDHVEVFREWANIDLLLAIHQPHGAPWVICIENKIESSEHSEQLSRYRRVVEKRYSAAERRIFIFLTKSGDSPSDGEYIPTTYGEVVRVLDDCIKERKDSIKPDLRLLIDHYRELITDDFMTENESTKLAREIYLHHKRALDFIFEKKADPIWEASEALDSCVRATANELQVVPEVLGKGYVRFLPTAWDIPENHGSKAWGNNSRYLLCEVNLWSKRAELHVTAGRPPEAWADALWELAAQPPFKREWKKRPVAYIKPYKAISDISLEKLATLNEEDVGKVLLDWLRKELERPEFKVAVANLADLLRTLKAP